MENSEIIVLVVLEIFALDMICRLWIKEKKMHLIARLSWSFILLIRLFGVLLYGFVRSTAKEHSDHISYSDTSGAD